MNEHPVKAIAFVIAKSSDGHPDPHSVSSLRLSRWAR